jgi:hypothetical protein
VRNDTAQTVAAARVEFKKTGAKASTIRLSAPSASPPTRLGTRVSRDLSRGSASVWYRPLDEVDAVRRRVVAEWPEAALPWPAP